RGDRPLAASRPQVAVRRDLGAGSPADRRVTGTLRAMSEVHLTPSGPPETVLDPEPAEATQALEAALAAGGDPRPAVAQVVAHWPRCLAAWATLGDLGRDPIERYAAYRVGYHRGLDRLRANGWRGSGYVRWSH